MATQSDFRVKKGLIVGTTDTANPEAGTFTYDTDFETVDLTLDANVNARLAQDHYFYVKAGATITKGDVVYASGAVGNSGKIEASPYIANNTIDESVVLGVAAEDIATGAFGYVAQFGSIRHLDASGGLTTDGETWNNGVILYASPTYAGELTITKPSAPNQDIPIAFVISNNASSGTIAVRASRLGYHMDEVHDVEITSIADKDLLVYNTSNSRWENGKTIGDLTLTGELNGPATFYIDPAPHDPDTDGATNGLVVIRGDLQVDGTTTTVNSTTMDVADLNITLASGAANAAAADGAGITIDDGSGGTEPTILYGATPNAFNFNRNVGINTTITGGTTADTYLHIYSDEANITPLIKLQNNTGEDDSSEGVSIDFVGSGDKTAVGSRIIATRAAAGAHMDLRFHTQRNNFAMIIDESQQVGIGTDDPTVKLHIVSDATSVARFQGVNEGNLYITNDEDYLMTFQSSTSSGISFNTSGPNEVMRLHDTGQISLGDSTSTTYSSYGTVIRRDDSTAAPDPGLSGEAVLAVINNDTTLYAYSNIVLRAGTGDAGIAAVYQGAANDSDLILYTDGGSNGIERMRITNDGYTGIRTKTPNAPLGVMSVGGTGGDNTRTLVLYNNGTSYAGDALTAFNAATGYDVDDKASVTWHARGTSAQTLETHVSASTTEGVHQDRYVALTNSMLDSTALHLEAYYQWDGSGTSASDVVIPSTSQQVLKRIQSYNSGIGFDFRGDGAFYPTASTQDLGTSADPWQNIYTQDLNLSNEKKDEGNSVDGTKGNWTIQEGDEHLYIINNKSGKKYRFALEEIE